jgi:hypothetical protein
MSYLVTFPAYFAEKMPVKFLLKEITCPGWQLNSVPLDLKTVLNVSHVSTHDE